MSVQDIIGDVGAIIADMTDETTKDPSKETMQAMGRLLAGYLTDQHRIAVALEALVRKGMDP